MAPNRLLIISRSHNPLGGADRIIADLCRELPARGWNVTLGLTRGARFDDPDRYRKVHGELPIIEIDGRLGTRHARLGAIRSAIRRTRPGVVLAMRVFDACEAVATEKSARGRNAPRLALGIRSFEAPYISDVRRCAASLDLCVTSGNLIAEACRTMGQMEAERVVSIPGGVQPPGHRAQPRTPRFPIRLLYAGRLEQHQKRALDLVPLALRLARDGLDFRLDICGAGPDEQEIEQKLEPLVRARQVRLHGWVDRDRLYDEFYPAADCFLHFAAWEGVTIAPREAMVHGVVPIISEFTGLYTERQFLNGVNALTFPVGRSDLAADQVYRLLNTPGLMTRLSAAAVNSQTGVYSFSGAMDAWAETLERVVTLPAKRGPFPRIPDQLDGRLSRLGVPARVQSWARRLFKLPVRHPTPGSEWPTASGLMTAAEKEEIGAFGETLEAGKRHESAG